MIVVMMASQCYATITESHERHLSNMLMFDGIIFLSMIALISPEQSGPCSSLVML